MRYPLNLTLVLVNLLLLVLAPSMGIGQLPKELPLWFKLLDTDRDGQVSLAEWRKGGKSLEEFSSWDRNNDGLITLEEFLYKVRLNPEANPEEDNLTAIRLGKEWFTREWTVNDPLCGKGDGLGPVFNANSCVHCHFKGGLGGSGDLKHNVTTFVYRRIEDGKTVQGVLHAHATSPDYQENLAHVHPAFPALVRPTLGQTLRFPSSSQILQLSQRNTPALFGAKLIDELPDQVILANLRIKKLGRAMRLPDGSVGKFGWKAQSPNLLDFVQAACANELGLGNPGHPQPTPLGQVSYRQRTLDLTLEQCVQMTAFIGSLPRPIEMIAGNPVGQRNATRGRQLFHEIGCADCHVPNMGTLRGVYSDFLLHRMGNELQGSGSYNSLRQLAQPSSLGDEVLADEWRTPPLWGVADSAPYLHDGQAPTLTEAILKHGGQAAGSAGGFHKLDLTEQEFLIYFLNSLRAPR